MLILDRTGESSNTGPLQEAQTHDHAVMKNANVYLICWLDVEVIWAAVWSRFLL